MKRLLLGLLAILLAFRREQAHPQAEAEHREKPRPPRKMHRVLIALALLMLAGAGGAIVLVFGVVPVKASAGHWAVTEWVLQFAKRRSVATHSIGLRPPESLDDPALIVKGAGHFDFGCRPCHGSPELPQPRVAQAMLPVPPYLPTRVPSWEPAELFYIVKHGLKFTGMPAWPAQARDDEVWAMVAFLRQLPGLDVGGYQQLVHGPSSDAEAVAPVAELEAAEPPAAVIQSCARCHGVAGRGHGTGAFPRLAGQRPRYLLASLQAFSKAKRASGVMQPIAAGLDPGEMAALARYYAQLPPGRSDVAAVARDPAPGVGSDQANSETAPRGAGIAQLGIPGQGVPSCADCHGPADQPQNPVYPRLAGQYADYLSLQLRLFKRGVRGGSPYAHIMRQIASRLTEAQIADVAAFYASLSSGSLGRQTGPGNR